MTEKFSQTNIPLQTIFDERLFIGEDQIFFDGRKIRYVNEILRFTEDISYSTGNFSKLRENYAKLQLDSFNKTQDRLKTALHRTQWPADFFRGKLVLECGCGAGPDTEVLLNLGARVVSVDLAGVDICKLNIGNNPNFFIAQASIDDLPFRKKAFDIVWCHRVLQHTPSPQKVLSHILSFVKDDGAVFIHSYARSLSQMLSWKYFLRPITCRMEPEFLYRMIRIWVPPLFRLTNSVHKIKPELLGKLLFRICHHLMPIRNYRSSNRFRDKDDDFIIELAIHNTFDALSPKYDRPLSVNTFKKIAEKKLKNDFEIAESPGVTLLRSKLKHKNFSERRMI